VVQTHRSGPWALQAIRSAHRDAQFLRYTLCTQCLASDLSERANTNSASFLLWAQTEQHRVQVSPAGRCTGQTLTQSGQVQHGNQWPLHTYSVSDGADMPVQAVQNCASCSKMGPCRRQLGSTNALATMVMFESAVKHDMNRLWYCRHAAYL
jgi:hypothetical protein